MRRFLARHTWVLPALGFLATRLWLLAVPLGYVAYRAGTIVVNDVELYALWGEGLRSGHYPVDDEMWQYPPLAGPVFALGSVLPPDPIRGFMLLMLVVDTAIFVMLARKGRSLGTMQGAWAWVLTGLLVGPVMLTRFDLVPTLFAVAALLAIDRPGRVGVALGLGALLKVWPVLLLLSLPRRRLLSAGIALACTVAAVLLGIGLWADGTSSFLAEQRARGLQAESVGAWLFLIAFHLGHPREFVYQYGAMEVVAEGIGPVALAFTLLGLLGLASVALLRITGRLEPVGPADVALAAILISMATSRVLSPQYLIWVAGIASVCLLDRRTRMALPIGLLIVHAMLTQMIYPMWYHLLLSDGLVGLALQTGRILLLLAATGIAAYRITPWYRPSTSQIGVDSGEHQRQPA